MSKKRKREKKESDFIEEPTDIFPTVDQTPVDEDTAGGTTGGGGNEGSQIGEDGLTSVGDADIDPEIADEVIDANADGSQAGQVGHQGIDEGTE